MIMLKDLVLWMLKPQRKRYLTLLLSLKTEASDLPDCDLFLAGGDFKFWYGTVCLEQTGNKGL